MLKNYFLIALRNLTKSKGFALINIFGLAVGMACCLMILLFVEDELSYDGFHENADSLHRVISRIHNAETRETIELAATPYRLADALKAEFPGIAAITRVKRLERKLLSSGELQFYESGGLAIEPAFLEMFDFALRSGDLEAALRQPYSLLLTPAMARKYFGDGDPLDKTVSMDGQELRVAGVLEEARNSHFSFDFLVLNVPAETVFSPVEREYWGVTTSYTYLLLPPGQDPGRLESALPAFVRKHIPEAGSGVSFKLQAVSDIHLHSQASLELAPGGDIAYVYAFSAIALFVLSIACINFMNLATAMSAKRGKEVGMRKVMGAGRGQLVRQFLGESLLLALLGMLLAVCLVELALPGFNAVMNKELALDPWDDGAVLLALAGITLLVGVIAGSYPALFLASFEPLKVFKGLMPGGGKAEFWRKALVTFQFAVSIFMIAGTAVIYSQLAFTRDMQLGFDKERVVVISNVPDTLRRQYEQFSAELRSLPAVLGTTASSLAPPGPLGNRIGIRAEGHAEAEGMPTIWTDFGFVETLRLDLAAGRSLSRAFPTDERGGFLINEAAARYLGWTPESAIGKRFASQYVQDGEWVWQEGQVVGVVRDSHFESLHAAIAPNVIFIAPLMAGNYLVRIGPENVAQSLEQIQEVWTRFVPGLPFEYSFLDQRFDGLYRAERQQGSLFGAFAGLSVLVACLGILGLASFNSKRRGKEIGVRKVMGGSVWSIVLLLTNDFSKLVLLSNLFAWPVAWVAMNRWLENFAYRIDLSPMIFVGSGLIALCIAWVTVGGTAARAASAKPVLALRYE